MNTRKIEVGQLVAGDVVATEDETIFGWRKATHRVAKVFCDLHTRLVEVELRDGPTLVYLWRKDNNAFVEVPK